MDNVYLISLIVGGFFVLLSIFGLGDTDADVDVDADFDLDADAGVDLDADFDSDLDVEAHYDTGAAAPGAGAGWVDLFSIRALFLFAAFFGLTGVLLNLSGTVEPLRAVLAVSTGLVVGLGGNYLIKRFGYAAISSEVTIADIRGKTGRVMLPFDADSRGKIQIEARGQRLQLTARPLDGESAENFRPGEEVVVVRMDGPVAEVVKPN